MVRVSSRLSLVAAGKSSSSPVFQPVAGSARVSRVAPLRTASAGTANPRRSAPKTCTSPRAISPPVIRRGRSAPRLRPRHEHNPRHPVGPHPVLRGPDLQAAHVGDQNGRHPQPGVGVAREPQRALDTDPVEVRFQFGPDRHADTFGDEDAPHPPSVRRGPTSAGRPSRRWPSPCGSTVRPGAGRGPWRARRAGRWGRSRVMARTGPKPMARTQVPEVEGGPGTCAASVRMVAPGYPGRPGREGEFAVGRSAS